MTHAGWLKRTIDPSWTHGNLRRSRQRRLLEMLHAYTRNKTKGAVIYNDKENEAARKRYFSMGFQELGEQGDDINADIGP